MTTTAITTSKLTFNLLVYYGYLVKYKCCNRYKVYNPKLMFNHLCENDIGIVMLQSNRCRDCAINLLKDNGGDIVDAIINA